MDVEVTSFLRRHHDGKSPLLLAFSGGSDSMVLLSILLKYKSSYGLDLHLAHVDHGWRPQSARQASQLKQLAAAHGLIFHLHRLVGKPLANLEEEGRKARYAFFARLQKTVPFQAVLTAHHLDDKIETVLKLLLEGACLTRLKGPAPIAQMGTLTIWRPLLGARKSQLAAISGDLPSSPILDESNGDRRFLRARMRLDILPSLERAFGKNVTLCLSRLANSSHEWSQYLDRRIQGWIQTKVVGPWGVAYDLSSFESLEKLEAAHFLRHICASKGLCPSLQQIELMSASLCQKIAIHSFCFKNIAIEIDRGRLFLVENRPHMTEGFLSVEASCGSWQVRGGEMRAPHQAASTGWQSVWQGHVFLQVPAGPISLSLYANGSKSVKKRFSHAKIPAFLRHFFPLLAHESGWAGDGFGVIKSPSFPKRSLSFLAS